MEKKGSLIVEHDFFYWKIVSNWVYFGQGEDLKLTTGTFWKSAIFPKPSNQKQLKWSNTAYFNKWSFAFKKNFVSFQETKTSFCIKVIRIFNVQPVRIPHFKNPLNKQAFFLMFISWMLITPSFKKSLKVDQFQRNFP